MATCSLCEKKIIEYEATLTALQVKIKHEHIFQVKYKQSMKDLEGVNTVYSVHSLCR